MAGTTSIMRANQIVLARLDEALRPLGLTFARYEALTLLSFTKTGRLPMAKIGDRLMVHPASVTHTIDRLERDGLVRREPDPRDRRGRLAVLTPAGRKLARKAAKAVGDVQFGLPLEPKLAEQLVAILKEFRRTAGDFSDGPADATGRPHHAGGRGAR